MRNVGGSVRPTGESIEMRLARIEKLLETINLRLAATPWKPPERNSQDAL